MNERIKELAEQAGIVFWEMSGDVDWRQANRENLGKFAELIVRECARLAMTQHHKTHSADYDEMDLYDHGRDDTASRISELIRRTFGVE